MEKDFKASVRLLVFCEHCGGPAKAIVFPNNEAMREAFLDVHPVTNWQGRPDFYPDKLPLFVFIVRYRGLRHHRGQPGWTFAPRNCPTTPAVYHQCSPKLVTSDSIFSLANVLSGLVVIEAEPRRVVTQVSAVALR